MKIGIITYHSPYNFGSALQAFATQLTVSELGYEPEIINYRLTPQIDFYYPLYRKKIGIRNYLQDLMMVPLHKGRLKRRKMFERFFSKYYKTTARFSDPEQVQMMWSKYPVIISGSDQIWNRHSNELANTNWEKYIQPYTLHGYLGKKISYASCIGNMSTYELQKILPDIEMFDFLSMRENSSAIFMSRLLGKKVANVCDPTLLLSGKEWLEVLDIKKTKPAKPYILYYSLDRIMGFKRNLGALKKISKKFDCDIKIIMPFAYFPTGNLHFHYSPDYGPREFVSAVYGAQMVITDSYHGSLFGMYLHKKLYSLSKSEAGDFRKVDVLKRMGMDGSIYSSVEDVLDRDYPTIDYDAVEQNLSTYRKSSRDYLSAALAACV